MKLTDYPTPRTNRSSMGCVVNAHWLPLFGKTVGTIRVSPTEVCEQLEREAAAWKEVAEAIHSASNLDELQAAHEAFDALKSQLTQP